MKTALTRQDFSTLEYIRVMLRGFMNSPNAHNYKSNPSMKIDTDGFKELVSLNFEISDNVFNILLNEGYTVHRLENYTEIYRLW